MYCMWGKFFHAPFHRPQLCRVRSSRSQVFFVPPLFSFCYPKREKEREYNDRRGAFSPSLYTFFLHRTHRRRLYAYFSPRYISAESRHRRFGIFSPPLSAILAITPGPHKFLIISAVNGRPLCPVSNYQPAPAPRRASAPLRRHSSD